MASPHMGFRATFADPRFEVAFEGSRPAKSFPDLVKLLAQRFLHPGFLFGIVFGLFSFFLLAI